MQNWASKVQMMQWPYVTHWDAEAEAEAVSWVRRFGTRGLEAALKS